MKKRLAVISIGIVTIIAIVTTALLFSFWFTPINTTNDTIYPLRAEVVSVGKVEPNVIECEDAQGNLWGFYVEDDEYTEGDFVLLLMDTCNTKIIYDDAVVSVRLDPFAY